MTFQHNALNSSSTRAYNASALQMLTTNSRRSFTHQDKPVYNSVKKYEIEKKKNRFILFCGFVL